MSAATAPEANMAAKRPFRIRAITAFVTLHASDFDNDADGLAGKINACNDVLRTLEKNLTKAGYEVQTVRIATNPFGEWLTTSISKNGDGTINNDAGAPQKRAKTNISVDEVKDRLRGLNGILDSRKIDFFSLGPSMTPGHTTDVCPLIVSMHPGRFCCSANINAGDIESALAAARCIQQISRLSKEDVPNLGPAGDASHVEGGLGNFRFCASSCVETVPFFPGAKAPPDAKNDSLCFAIGLENGGLANDLLKEANNIGKIKTMFDTRMREELMPIQGICLKFVDAADFPVKYLGIDTSFNPSLDDGGSVAEAIERLEEVRGDFGGTGSLAAAATITSSLQSIPDIRTTGYSGLMLPVLEDQHLARLSSSSRDQLTIQRLLCISSVCGVGVDMVPIPGDVSEESLSSLVLDVAALAGRWNKPLTCRVFPVPGGKAGEKTKFNSPYMCNSSIFEL